jgi:hypothetical protein
MSFFNRQYTKFPNNNVVKSMVSNQATTMLSSEETVGDNEDATNTANGGDDEDKDTLKEAIKKWVNNDNEMRALNEEMAKRKKLNKEYTENLMKLIKKTEIQTVDINNGSISYVQRNQKKPITNKLLNDVLIKYYNGDMEEVNRITNFIMDHREISVKEIIVRKIRDT